jgi:hypothetical protein
MDGGEESTAELEASEKREAWEGRQESWFYSPVALWKKVCCRSARPQLISVTHPFSQSVDN